MAQVDIADGALEVRFTLFEKVFGLVWDQRFPLSTVAEAHAEPDGLRAVHGLRSPGLGMPGMRKVGTWRGRGGKTLVSVTRGQPALVVNLSGAKYAKLVLGCAHPEGYVERIPAHHE